MGGERGMGAARQPNGNIATMYNEPDGSAAPSNVGSVIDHFSVYVADVDAAVEMARSMGATIDTEPQEGVTVSRIAYIVDPWGTRLEFLEDPDSSGLGHVHLMVNDRDEVRDWFLEIFGGEYDSERGGGRYHAIKLRRCLDPHFRGGRGDERRVVPRRWIISASEFPKPCSLSPNASRRPAIRHTSSGPTHPGRTCCGSRVQAVCTSRFPRPRKRLRDRVSTGYKSGSWVV